MNRIEVPTFEPCGSCNGGKVLRHGKSEQCDCWVTWWQSVKAVCVGDAAQRVAEGERKR